MATNGGDNQSSLSFSAMQDYRDCELIYKYGRQLGLQLRGGRTSHDLRYGSAGHVALANLYKGETLRTAGESFMTAYPIDDYPDPLPRFAPGKSQQNFLNALWAYIKGQWQEDQRQWEVLSVELPESTEGLGEYDHALVKDLVVRDREDGLVWGVDHKITGSYLDDRFWSRHELSSQVRMYVDDIKRRYGNCGGFIINAISLRHRERAVTPRKGPNKGIRLEAGDWFEFGRMTYRPGRESLELERQNVVTTSDDIRRSIATDTWSYNTARCHGGTDYACPFITICQPGWSWPQNEAQITEYYRQVCGRRIATEMGMGHCALDRDHDGDCDVDNDNESPPPMIIVAPEDDPYFNAVED